MDLRAVLATALCLSVGVIGAVPEEQCHTFAGGAVYPNTEGRASGHSLQWTKAMMRRHGSTRPKVGERERVLYLHQYLWSKTALQKVNNKTMALRTLGLALSRMSLAPALPRGVPALRAPTLTSTPVQTRLPPAAARAASTTCGVASRWTFTSFAARTPSSSSSSYLVAAAVPASAGKTLVVQARQLATSQAARASLQQMHKTGPVKKKRKNKNPLGKKAFSRGVVLKTLIKKPRKPNSANRKCVLVRLSTGREMVAYVPGEGHNLQEHNIVLVRPGRLQDVPGVKVKCIRGKYDLQHVIKRKK